jgi:lipopolysaccharide/colanic/teichoic acid biosynthesis glycosyltransferase
MNRAADVALAGGALLLASPVLGIAALAVKLGDGGPVLYRQTRVGKDGVDFELLKLRTMVVDAENQGAGLAVDKGDTRITHAGRVLRKLSVDELPQLWNVLRGEMSLVGPRPLLAEYLDTYTPEERRRHDMRPGVTSWAAVNGRHVLGFKERLQLDIWYVDHWSLALDLRILALTVRQVIRGTDVSTTQDMAAVGFPLPGVSPRLDDERVSDDDPASS